MITLLDLWSPEAREFSVQQAVNIAKTIVAIILMSLAWLGIWRVYDSYVQQQKDVYWSIEDKPTKEQLTELLDKITVGMPKPIKTDDVLKQNSMSMYKYYAGPNGEIEHQLIDNIKQQKIWEQTELEESEGIGFCHNQFTALVAKANYGYLEEDSGEVFVKIGWYRTGGCRGKYIQSLNLE